MDEDIIPIIVLGLGFALIAIKMTSGYIQGEVAGIPGRGYDITQPEPPLVIPLSKQKGGVPPPPVAATPQNLSKEGTQMPYGVVPADIATHSLIDQPVQATAPGGPAAQAGQAGQAGQGGPTIRSLGPTSLSNPNTPPDVKLMLANAPPDF